jgi:signal transduction histidine kinase
MSEIRGSKTVQSPFPFIRDTLPAGEYNSLMPPNRLPRLLIQTMRERKQIILKRITEWIRKSDFVDFYRAFLTETQEGKRRIGILYELLIEGIQGNLQPLIDDQLRTGYVRARKEVPLDNTLQFHRMLERIIIDEFLALHGGFELDPKDLYEETRILGYVVDKAKEMVSKSYIKTKEELIEKRTRQIESLYNLRIAMDNSVTITQFSLMLTNEVSKILGDSYVVVSIYHRQKNKKMPFHQSGNSPSALELFREGNLNEVQRKIFGVQVPHLVDHNGNTLSPISPEAIGIFPRRHWLLIPIFTKQNFYGFLSVTTGESEFQIGADAYVVLSVVSKIAQALERNHTLRTLRNSKTELKRLTNKIIHVQEEDRRKVSAEIHDTIIQRLTAIWLKLQYLKDRNPSSMSEFHGDFELLNRFTNESIEEARRIVSRLRPPGLDELGVQKALEGYVKFYQEQTAIKVDLLVEGDGSNLPPEKQISIFRILQEAMENVRKHSNSSYARVHFKCSGNRCSFSVADFGTPKAGFFLNRCDTPPSHFGLKIMKERAEAMGGTLRYGPAKGKGFIVRGNIPIT